MAGETLTLKLEGQVSLADFASAMGDFQALVDSLTQHIARGATIDWYIEELDSGSSLTTVAGESESRQALLRNEHQITSAFGTAL
jgi:hypothetical protein